MASCQKCGLEEPTLSDGLCASCELVFGTGSTRRRKALDLAYGGYSLSGLFFLFMSAWMAGFVSYPAGFALLIYLEVPLLIFAAPLVLVAVALSLKFWRHWPLPVLGAMTVLLAVVLVRTELSTPVATRVYAVYGLVIFMFSGLWFGRTRNLERRASQF